MPIFRKKQPEAPSEQDLSFVTHRQTQDLAMAGAFAMMLAKDRDRSTLEIADILAGMYIVNFERIVKYWPDSEALETFVEDHCQVNRERWLYWFEYCEQMYHHPKPWRLGRLLISRKGKRGFVWGSFKRSPDLEAIYRAAEGLTPHRSSHPFTGRELPVITSECLLLSIALQTNLDISGHLRKSGLDMQSLEKAVRYPKREPRL